MQKFVTETSLAVADLRESRLGTQSIVVSRMVCMVRHIYKSFVTSIICMYRVLTAGIMPHETAFSVSQLLTTDRMPEDESYLIATSNALVGLRFHAR